MTSSSNPEATPARYWRTIADGRIECDLCPRACQLQDGQRAYCFVRQNVDGKMVLTSYGRASGFCIDPIEKKPLNHFYPGSSVLSFGTAGCNLGCHFCQNWDISKAREMDRVSDIATPEAIAHTAVESGCRSVAFTYNDPVIFAEYAIDTAKACHERDIKSVAVTAGYIGEQARKDFFSVIDAANVDLKAFSESFYKTLCAGELEPVKDTLRYIKNETDVWLEVTTLIIPHKNDSPEEIDRMCDWFVSELGPSVPLHFSAFHPDFRMLDNERTPAATLLRARQQAKSHGIEHVFVGNVHDPIAQATTCPSCDSVLIERDWYQLGAYSIDAQGRCDCCRQSIAGHFADTPGTWGRRRLPIAIGR